MQNNKRHVIVMYDDTVHTKTAFNYCLITLLTTPAEKTGAQQQIELCLEVMRSSSVLLLGTSTIISSIVYATC